MKKLFFVMLFSLAWSASIFINKFTLAAGADPLVYTLHTTGLAALILSIMLALSFPARRPSGKASSIMPLLLLGAMVGGAYIAGVYGLKYSTSINYSFLVKSTVIFVLVEAAVLLDEKLSLCKIVLLLLFIGGVYLLTTSGRRLVPRTGDLLILVAACGFGSATVLTKTISTRSNAVFIAWGRIFFAFLTLVVVCLLCGQDILSISHPWSVLMVGLLNPLLTISLNKALELASASYTSMMSMIVPVINTLLGYVFLSERIDGWQIVGAAIILVSGVLVQRSEI